MRSEFVSILPFPSLLLHSLLRYSSLLTSTLVCRSAIFIVCCLVALLLNLFGQSLNANPAYAPAGRLVKTFGGDQTHFALKIMKKNEIVQMKQFDHILSEVTLLNLLNHPFIVNMVSHFQDENRLYLVLEFIYGGELFRLLRGMKKFTNPQVS